MKLKWRPRNGQWVTSYQFVWVNQRGNLMVAPKRRSLDVTVADYMSARLANDVHRGYIRYWYTTPTGQKRCAEEVIWPSERAGTHVVGMAAEVGPTDA